MLGQFSVLEGPAEVFEIGLTPPDPSLVFLCNFENMTYICNLERCNYTKS